MRKKKYFAVPLLIAVNIVVFLLSCAGIGTVHQLGVYAAATINHGQWYRVLTAQFSHFNISHLLFNMAALYSIGYTIERTIGSWKLLALYLSAGALGNALSLCVFLSNHQDVLLAGASGAIFALLGHLTYMYIMRDKYRLYAFGGGFVRGIVFTFLLSSLSGGSFVGHLCGFVFGFIISGIMFPLRVFG